METQTQIPTGVRNHISTGKLIAVILGAIFLLCMCCFFTIVLFNRWEDHNMRGKVNKFNQRILDN